MVAENEKAKNTRPDKATRESWYRQHLVEGKSIHKIAGDKHDQRTVKRNIDSVRRDKVIEQARINVHERAWTDHQDDLKNYLDVILEELEHEQLTFMEREPIQWEAIRRHLAKTRLVNSINTLRKVNTELQSTLQKQPTLLLDKVDQLIGQEFQKNPLLKDQKDNVHTKSVLNAAISVHLYDDYRSTIRKQQHDDKHQDIAMGQLNLIRVSNDLGDEVSDAIVRVIDTVMHLDWYCPTLSEETRAGR